VKKKVKVCPICNSQDINLLYTASKWEQATAFFRNKCNNCGYIGPMTIMGKEGADKLKVLKPRKRRK